MDTEQLYLGAPPEEAIAALPEVRTTSNMEMGAARRLVIDRDKTAALAQRQGSRERVLTASVEVSSTITDRAFSTGFCSTHDPKYQRQADCNSRRSRSRRRAVRRALESIVKFGNRRAADDQPFGPAPAVTISFGLRPGVSLGTATSHIKGCRCLLRPPSDQLHRIGQGVRGIDEKPRPALFVAIGVVYRPRSPLRELHPPLTILRSAVCRFGRARHALALRQRAQHLLVCRPRVAGGPREEERDHANRLRARSRAPARQIAGRSDLRRVCDPLPSDHDDDHGGAARIVADRGRHGGRRGAAAPRPAVVGGLLVSSSSRSI